MLARLDELSLLLVLNPKLELRARGWLSEPNMLASLVSSAFEALVSSPPHVKTTRVGKLDAGFACIVTASRPLADATPTNRSLGGGLQTRLSTGEQGVFVCVDGGL